jgi:hypothetical protein
MKEEIENIKDDIPRVIVTQEKWGEHVTIFPSNINEIIDKIFRVDKE